MYYLCDITCSLFQIYFNTDNKFIFLIIMAVNNNHSIPPVCFSASEPPTDF